MPETEGFGLDGVKCHTGVIAMRPVDLCDPQEYMQGRRHSSHLETGVSARCNELSGIERKPAVRGPASMMVHCPFLILPCSGCFIVPRT